MSLPVFFKREKLMADIQEFPDCCGLFIVSDFKGGHPNSNPDGCMKPEAVDDYLRLQEQEYYRHRAGLMAILSQPQEDRIGKVFRNRRWKLLQEVMNPRTGKKLFIYFRDLNPTVAREKRIFVR